VVAVEPSDAAERTLSHLSADAFGELTQPYRRELLRHCYRMLGTLDDAEDAVQEALVRAWRGRNTFQRQISFRAWLYRIATNACLDAIERRKRSQAGDERLGVGPYPDELDVAEEATAGPEARFDAHESISLAFLTALQLLPPRQRAVLILRDVLTWRANETAELLELSVPAVNSALHRARTTVSRGYTPASREAPRPPRADPGHLRSLLDRYVRAWESADVAGLVSLLRDDAVLSMPPAPSQAGAAQIGAFLTGTLFAGGRRIRLVPIRANGGPGFFLYTGSGADTVLHATAVLLLEVRETGIARIDAFFDEGLAARFGLAGELGA